MVGNTSVRQDHQCETGVRVCGESTANMPCLGRWVGALFPVQAVEEQGHLLFTQKAQVNDRSLNTCTLICMFWVMEEPEVKPNPTG